MFVFIRCVAFTKHLQHTRCNARGDPDKGERVLTREESSQCRGWPADRELHENSTVKASEVGRQGYGFCLGELRSFAMEEAFDLSFEFTN